MGAGLRCHRGFESISAAKDRVGELTNGQGADVCILTAGIVHNDLISDGFHAIRKAGTLVVTGVSPDNEEALIPGLNANHLANVPEAHPGCLVWREVAPRGDSDAAGPIPGREAQLDELITKTYTLDEINIGYDDMRNGRNIRGIIQFTR